MRQKRREDVFLRAAQHLASTRISDLGACEAIWRATTGSWDDVWLFKMAPEGEDVRRFIAMFKPLGTSSETFWLDEPDQTAAETHDRRIIALLLAHEMRKTGDL